jgi:hypothetical protein
MDHPASRLWSGTRWPLSGEVDRRRTSECIPRLVVRRTDRRAFVTNASGCRSRGHPSSAWQEVAMRVHPGRTLSVLVIAAVALAAALGLVLAVEPAAEPAIVLVGAVVALILYGVLYLVERRRHW